MNKYLNWIEKEANLLTGVLSSLGRAGLKASSGLKSIATDALGGPRMNLINEAKFGGNGTARQLHSTSQAMNKLPTRPVGVKSINANFNANLRAQKRLVRPLASAPAPLKSDGMGGFVRNPESTDFKNAGNAKLDQASKQTLDGRLKLGVISGLGLYGAHKIMSPSDQNQYSNY